MSSDKVYRLKITLRYSKPPIWRRVLVPADTALGDLHHIIQTVMGWWDYHLHQFTVGDTCYGPLQEHDSSWGGLGWEEEDGITLEQVASRTSRFIYEYDFGDGWEHVIRVEKALEPEPGQKYPVCIKGKMACPPEDVGGMFGYYNFLEAIRDPSHPEHEMYVEWAEEGFDPEAFDLEEVNKALRDLRR